MEATDHRRSGGEASREVKAGRGFLFITAAKLYFLAAGAAIEFVLPHLLPAAGRAGLFGLYKVVVGIVSVINNVIVTVTIQSVSKFVAEDDARQGQVTRAGFRMMALIGIVLAGAFVVAAPLLAGFENDAQLVPYLRIAAAIIFGYSMYSVLVGVANGRREFHKQAGLDMTFSTLRALGVLGAVALGFSIRGAFTGWAVASLLIFGVALVVVRVPKKGDAPRFPATRLGGFFGQVGLYTLLLNLLLWVGMLLLKHYSTKETVGYFAPALALSVLSYQVMIALIFVVFPLMSRATFEGDAEKARTYVGQAMRYSLLLAAAFGVVLAAKPTELLRIPYPPEFAVAGPALRVLSLGFVCFSVIAVAGSILNGAGRTSAAIVTMGATLAVAAAANWIAIPRAPDALLAAAYATAAAMVVGLILVSIALRQAFGAALSLVTAVRVAAAVAAGIAVGRFLPARGKTVTLVECAVIGIIYVVVLLATREITGADLARLRRRGA